MRVRAALCCVLLVVLVWGLRGPQPERFSRAADGEASSPDEGGSGGSVDPLGPNAACYVCHMTFVREAISRVHLAHQVGCIRCHGVSAGHANDENIGATPPDVVYSRDEVDGSCGKCHKTHNVPAREVVARFLKRKLPRAPAAVCTDCHGHHRIDRAALR